MEPVAKPRAQVSSTRRRATEHASQVVEQSTGRAGSRFRRNARLLPAPARQRQPDPVLWSRLGLPPARALDIAPRDRETLADLLQICAGRAVPRMLVCRTPAGPLFAPTSIEHAFSARRLIRLARALQAAGLAQASLESLLAHAQSYARTSTDSQQLREATAMLSKNGGLALPERPLIAALPQLRSTKAQPAMAAPLAPILACLPQALEHDPMFCKDVVRLLRRGNFDAWLQLEPQQKFVMAKVLVQWLDSIGLPLDAIWEGGVCEASLRAYRPSVHRDAVLAMARLLDGHDAAPPELLHALATLLRGTGERGCADPFLADLFARSGAKVCMTPTQGERFARLVRADAAWQIATDMLHWTEQALEAPDRIQQSLIGAALTWLYNQLDDDDCIDRMIAFGSEHNSRLSFSCAELPDQAAAVLAQYICSDVVIRLRGVLSQARLPPAAAEALAAVLTVEAPHDWSSLLKGWGVAAILIEAPRLRQQYRTAAQGLLNGFSTPGAVMRFHDEMQFHRGPLVSLVGLDDRHPLLHTRMELLRVATVLLTLERLLELPAHTAAQVRELATYLQSHSTLVGQYIGVLEADDTPPALLQGLADELARIERRAAELPIAWR